MYYKSSPLTPMDRTSETQFQNSLFYLLFSFLPPVLTLWSMILHLVGEDSILHVFTPFYLPSSSLQLLEDSPQPLPELCLFPSLASWSHLQRGRGLRDCRGLSRAAEISGRIPVLSDHGVGFLCGHVLLSP